MASPLMEWFPFIPRLAFSFLQTQVIISLVPGPVRKEVYAPFGRLAAKKGNLDLVPEILSFSQAGNRA